MKQPELSLAERRYLENEEFNRNNVDEVRKPVKVGSKALAHRAAHGYSPTFAKLMKKYNCATADEWRALRKQMQQAKKKKTS